MRDLKTKTTNTMTAPRPDEWPERLTATTRTSN